MIFREAKDVISILGPNAVFLPPEDKEPSVPVRVSCIEGCEEGARESQRRVVVTNLAVWSRGKLLVVWPGRRTPSAHDSCQVVGQFVRGTLQSGCFLLTWDL